MEGGKMVLRHLEILEAIAETGAFTNAAKKLFITQSAVSHAVAELEKQAGTALFERLPKGVALTHCGVSLLEESRGYFIGQQKFRQKNKPFRRKHTGQCGVKHYDCFFCAA